MSSEQRAQKNRGRKRRRAIWIVALIVLLVAIAFAKPAYHWLKSRRADQLAAEGDALIVAGQFNEAAGKFRAALQLDPLGEHPLRSAARLATKAGRPEALDLWEQVVRQNYATAQDRQEFVALLIRTGRMAAAERTLTQLLQELPDTKTLSLAAQFSSRSGSEAKAIEFAQAAARRAPDDNDAQFSLAELLAGSNESANRSAAREVLWKLAGKSGATRKPAIEALARAPELSADEQQRVLSLLADIKPPNAIDDLLAADLELKLHPEQAEQIYDKAVARWQQSDLADLVRWLNLHEQSARALALLPLDRALSNEALLLARLDALATDKNWSEIEAMLNRADLKLDPSVIESFRARTAVGRSAALDADVHWNRAIALANNDPVKLRFVATFAEQSQAKSAALKAYEQLARFPAHAAFAFRSSQRLNEQNGDALAARGIAEKLLALSPDDANAQAQVVYLNLLLNSDVQTNLAKAKNLVGKFPNRLSFRVAAALGFLRAHDVGSALAQFKGPTIDWSRTPPSWRAVYAAALLQNDDADAAQKIIGTIPLERLNKEERALIDRPNE